MDSKIQQMDLIPNRGLHNRWDPKLSPALATTDDAAKASAYLINTAWLRSAPITGGANALFYKTGSDVSTSKTTATAHVEPSMNDSTAAFSSNDPASSRYQAELEILEGTDSQYIVMLRRLVCAEDAAATPQLCSLRRSILSALAKALSCSVKDTLTRQVYGSVRAASPSATKGHLICSISDPAGLAAHVALTVRGVSEWLRGALPETLSTDLIREWEVSASASLDTLKKECVLPDTFSIGEFAVDEVASQLVSDGTHQSSFPKSLLSAGLLVGTHYFGPLMKIFPVFFIKWCTVVAKQTGTPPSELYATGLKALMHVAQRSEICLPVVHNSCMSAAATGGVTMASLVDGGSLQAIGTSVQLNPVEGLSGNSPREALVAMISRAALETFTEAVFVAGPLQWATVGCGGLVEAHPLVTGARNERSPDFSESSHSKERRVEGKDQSRKVAFVGVSPATSLGAWDVTVREILPIFLSQCGYEFPWHGVEAMLRSAVAPNTSSETVSKPWGPTASLRVERKRAMTVVDDTMVIIAKEVSDISFPSRLAGLTKSVPNSLTRLNLKKICLVLDRYWQKGSDAAKAHSDLFNTIAQRQKQRIQTSSASSRFGGAAPSLSVEALQSKALEDIDSLIKDRILSLDDVNSSLVGTPSTYATPILSTILALSGISTPLTLPAPSRGAHSGSAGQLIPSSGIFPTIVDIADLLDLVQIKVDLMPSIIELKAAAATASSAYTTPQMVATLRARVLMDVFLMAIVRLSQLRYADQIEYLLFGTGRRLLDAVKRVASDASSSAISSSAIGEVLASLRSPLPRLCFDFSKFLVEGSEGAARWQSDTLDSCHGYTPLSALMEGLFGSGSHRPLSPSSFSDVNPLLSDEVLSLEAFAEKVLLRVASAEFADIFREAAALRSGHEAGDLLRPVSSPSVDVIGWCLLYAKATGLGLGADASGFSGRFSFAVQASMKGAVNASTAAAHYTAISPFLNPLIVDHPTRGYAVRKVLWAVGELFAKALVVSSEALDAHSSLSSAKFIAMEARKFVSALEAFGILEWSYFGALWATRFVPLIKSFS